MAEHLPRPARDERVVTSIDHRGKLITRKERVRGREFSCGVNDVGELVTGYVTDGRHMMDILGSLHAPGHFFQVWCKLLSLQKLGEKTRGNVPGRIRTTQRDLQTRCTLPASSVNEAMRYFASLPWLRSTKPGEYQLNPYLTASGSSADQERWQEEWNAAKGEEFLMPGPFHVEIWREEEAARLAAQRDARRKKKDQSAGPVVPLADRKKKTGGTNEPADLPRRILQQHTAGA